MDYTKAHRSQRIPKLTKPLTIEALLETNIPAEIIDKCTYESRGQKRIRLVNSDQEYYRVPSIYNIATTELIEHLQQFNNVGPWSNEYVANSPYKSHRRLDLYLGNKDLDSLQPKQPQPNYKLPEVN